MVLLNVEIGGHQLVVDGKIVGDGQAVIVAFALDQITSWVRIGADTVLLVRCLCNFALVDDHDKANAFMIIVWIVRDCNVARVWANPLVSVLVKLCCEELGSFVIRMALCLNLICIEISAVNSRYERIRTSSKFIRSFVEHVELDAEVLICIVCKQCKVWYVGSDSLLGR